MRTPDAGTTLGKCTFCKDYIVEGNGMKVSRGRSCLSIVKKEFGWKGNRAKIMTLLADHIEKQLQ